MNAPAIPPIVAEDRQPQAPAQAPVAERHIGRPLPRTGARRLLQGRGKLIQARRCCHTAKRLRSWKRWIWVNLSNGV